MGSEKTFRFAGCSREFRYGRGTMQFNEQSKAAYVKIIRAKLKEQMGEEAGRIDLFSDDKIIEMHEKWRQRSMEEFRAKCVESRGEHHDRCGKFYYTAADYADWGRPKSKAAG